jgi:hypothetical protein
MMPCRMGQDRGNHQSLGLHKAEHERYPPGVSLFNAV